jgi:hypothetical protein
MQYLCGFFGPSGPSLEFGCVHSVNPIASAWIIAGLSDLDPASERAGTKSPEGIKTFRDCQVKALEEEAWTRAATKVKHAEAVSGQRDIFESLHEMAPNRGKTSAENLKVQR